MILIKSEFLIPKYPPMIAKMGFVITWMLLLSIRSSFQQETKCSDSSFPREGVCEPCPDRCTSCISDFICTTCESNYYGPICQHECQEECSDVCQKDYGYCTNGCPEGFYLMSNSSGKCLNCPAKCKLCKSDTECAECLPGFHGNTCEFRCSTYCSKCNITTGSCLACDEGYFHEVGRCHKCSDGCAICSDNNNCYGCKEHHLMLRDNQCIMECPNDETVAACNTFVPDQDDIKAHGCMNTTQIQDYVVKTKKPCIQYFPCSSSLTCPAKYDGKSACGAIRIYECRHFCYLTNEIYTCLPVCTIIQRNTSVEALCLRNNEAVYVPKLDTFTECFTESDNPLTISSQPCPPCSFIPIVLSVIFGPLCFAMAAYIICISSNSETKDDDTEENIVNKDADGDDDIGDEEPFDVANGIGVNKDADGDDDIGDPFDIEQGSGIVRAPIKMGRNRV